MRPSPQSRTNVPQYSGNGRARVLIFGIDCRCVRYAAKPSSSRPARMNARDSDYLELSGPLGITANSAQKL